MKRIFLGLIVCFLVVNSFFVFGDEASGVTHSGSDVIGGEIGPVNGLKIGSGNYFYRISPSENWLYFKTHPIGDTSYSNGITNFVMSPDGNVYFYNGIRTIGNVGIGTSSPDNGAASVGLDLLGYTTLAIDTDADERHGVLKLVGKNRVGEGGFGSVIFFHNKAGDYIPTARIDARRDGADDAGFISFLTRETGQIESYPLEKMRITSSGNVGIGTTTPEYELDIKGTNDMLRLMSTDTSAIYDGIAFFDSIGNRLSGIRAHNSGSPYPNTLEIWSESGNVWFSKGNVGIGTETPFAKLDVNGQIRSEHLSDTLGAGNLYSNWFALRTPVTGANGLHVDIFNGTAWKTSVTFAKNGNVGIGTITPVYKLDVVGDIKESGVICDINGCIGGGNVGGSGPWLGSPDIYYNGGNVGIGTTTPQAKLHIEGGHLSVSGTIYDALGTQLAIGDADDLTFNSGQMYIAQSSGNVGIGTTTPEYELDIKGTNDMLRLMSTDTSAIYDGIAFFDSIGNRLSGIRAHNSGSPYPNTLEIWSESGNVWFSKGNVNVQGDLQVTGKITGGFDSCVVRSATNAYSVNCNSGEVAVGGGGTCPYANYQLHGSSPITTQIGTAANAWSSSCSNSNGNTLPPVTTYAVCCPA